MKIHAEGMVISIDTAQGKDFHFEKSKDRYFIYNGPISLPYPPNIVERPMVRLIDSVSELVARVEVVNFNFVLDVEKNKLIGVELR